MVSKEHPAKDAFPIRAERTAEVSGTKFYKTIADILRILKHDVTALVIFKCDNRKKRADNLLRATLQSLINNKFDGKLKSADFEDCLF